MKLFKDYLINTCKLTVVCQLLRCKITEADLKECMGIFEAFVFIVSSWNPWIIVREQLEYIK